MQANDYRIEDLNLAVTNTGRKMTEEKQKKICNMDWTKLQKKLYGLTVRVDAFLQYFAQVGLQYSNLRVNKLPQASITITRSQSHCKLFYLLSREKEKFGPDGEGILRKDISFVY